MKKNLLTITIVCLLTISNWLQAQNNQNSLNQQELFKQFLGTWQATISEDSAEVWIFTQYGKAFLVTEEKVIKGQKSPNALNNISFSSKENRFIGYALYTSGSYVTWIGSFSSEKMFYIDLVQNLSPEMVTSKRQCLIENPNNWTYVILSKEGVKKGGLNFVRIK